MTFSRLFRIRKPDVIFEYFDNEVVLINLENGNYYSIQGIAAEIWGWIEAGFSQAGIKNQIMNRYQGVPKEIDPAIDLFMNELSREKLIEPFEPEARAGENPMDENLLPEKAPDRPAFTPPTLNRYTDMQDLLLLDPIHDVGEQGWPNPQSEATPQSD